MSRTVSTSRVVPWRDAFRELFALASENWSPPRTVRTTLNGRRDRLSMEARFIQPDGSPVKLTVICEKDQAGVWWSIEQKLDLRLTFKAQAGGR